MFTIYHAVVLIAVFVFGYAIGHSIGEFDGEEKAAREIDEYRLAKRRAEREGMAK